MSADDIENAAVNIKKTHELTVKTAEELRILETEIQRKNWRFLAVFKAQLKKNLRKNSPLNTDLNESWAIHKEIVELQEKKVEICQKTYDAIDFEVNEFDQKLNRYMERKEKARNNAASMERFAFLQKKKKKIKIPRERLDYEKSGEEFGNQGIGTEYHADPSEPIYCYCRRVAFGRMVACDGEHCQYEWFHFNCVGLTEDPIDEWYCSNCLAQKNVKKNEKTPKSVFKRKELTTLSPVKVKPIKRRKLEEDNSEVVQILRTKDSPTIKQTVRPSTPKKQSSVGRMSHVEKLSKKTLSNSASKSRKSVPPVLERILSNKNFDLTTPKKKILPKNVTNNSPRKWQFRETPSRKTVNESKSPFYRIKKN